MKNLSITPACWHGISYSFQCSIPHHIRKPTIRNNKFKTPPRDIHVHLFPHVRLSPLSLTSMFNFLQKPTFIFSAHVQIFGTFASICASLSGYQPPCSDILKQQEQTIDSTRYSVVFCLRKLYSILSHALFYEANLSYSLLIILTILRYTLLVYLFWILISFSLFVLIFLWER